MIQGRFSELAIAAKKKVTRVDDSDCINGVADLAVEALLRTALAGAVNDTIGEVVLQKLDSGT